MTSQTSYRTRRSEIRWTADEYTLLASRARDAGTSVSDYVRNAALDVQHASKMERAVLDEMRRIGALIKHNYPLVKSWSESEKKLYWQTRVQLLEYADRISQKIGSKVQPISKKEQKKEKTQ